MSEPLPKWTAQKVAILVIVLVFFVSSFALSVTVIYQAFFEKDSAATEQVENNNAVSEENMLEGTQLQAFEPVESVEALQIIDQKVGTGNEVKEGDTITAHYTGAVAATGKIFQSSKDTGQPFTSPLSGLIEGWQKGIPGMKEGGSRRLIIPAEQAYGANPPAGIPANAVLVFDIELVRIGE